MYRLLFQNTPTTQTIPNTCTICKLKQKETELHLFFTCKHIQPIKSALTKFLNTKTEHPTDIYRAIFINTLPKQGKQQTEVKLHILAIFRSTIWGTRLATKFRNLQITPDQLLQSFIAKTTHALTVQNQWQLFVKMLD